MQLTKEFLESFLKYDQETGLFYKKTKDGSYKMVGDDNGYGYLKIRIKGKSYRLHRLAFVMMGKELPPQVDHIDGVRSNNSWSNLRPSNNSLNSLNRHKPRGISGHESITFTKQNTPRVIVRKDGKVVFHKVFKTMEEAIKKRDEVKASLLHQYRLG